MRSRMLVGTLVVGGFLGLGAAGAGAQVSPYGTTPPTVASATTTVAPSTTVKIVGAVTPTVAGVATTADPGLAGSSLPVTGGDLGALGSLVLAGLGLVGVRSARRRTAEG